jgi:hydroxyacylglutathione hydrolase
MIDIHFFTFNAFQENTYIVYDKETKDCFIIDPGCGTGAEEKEMVDFIELNKLLPKRLINTHCHIDHVLGNLFVAEKYGLELEAHQLEIPVLQSGEQVSKMYGIPYKGSPKISSFLEEGEQLELGGNRLDILLTPGHSPGSISFYAKESKWVISGDVLFMNSIGRTDLPGGDYNTLIGSIAANLLPLPDDVKVYSGHGPSTTIGHERSTNPFLAGFRK